jgi:formylmethanofuran dehydrogenase subunit D
MHEADTRTLAMPVRTLFPSSADTVTVYTDEHGDVVIRHRDVFEDADTLVVIPREQARQLANAIVTAASGSTQ